MKTLITYIQQLGLFRGIIEWIPWFWKRVLTPHAKEYYSETGEDAIILALIRKDNGFYVDVGCHHPVSISNTYALYKLGWKGIAIDLNPTYIRLFQRLRPRDNAICAAISDSEKEMPVYEFEESAVHSLHQPTAEKWNEKYTPTGQRMVRTRTLTSLLDECKAPHDLDLLTIDTEGHELEVLRSLDFSKYQPACIVAEIHDFDIASVATHPICSYLYSKGYQLHGYVTMNAYFLRKKSYR